MNRTPNSSSSSSPNDSRARNSAKRLRSNACKNESKCSIPIPLPFKKSTPSLATPIAAAAIQTSTSLISNGSIELLNNDNLQLVNEVTGTTKSSPSISSSSSSSCPTSSKQDAPSSTTNTSSVPTAPNKDTYNHLRSFIKMKSRPKKSERIASSVIIISEGATDIKTDAIITNNNSTNNNNNHHHTKLSPITKERNDLTSPTLQHLKLQHINESKKTQLSSSIDNDTNLLDSNEKEETTHTSTNIFNEVDSHDSNSIENKSTILIKNNVSQARHSLIQNNSNGSNHNCKSSEGGHISFSESAQKSSANISEQATLEAPASSTSTNGKATVLPVTSQADSSTKTKETPSKNIDSKVNPRNQNMQVQTQPFLWDLYLQLIPAEIAPKEAFMQSPTSLTNGFRLGMKLEARDPRNESSWCLASVVGTLGTRLRLRFDGSDSMNDFFELIDSDNIRPIGSDPDSPLFAPLAFKGNLSTYPKFVEKILTKPDTIIAPPELFMETPEQPPTNLFQEGMKLEAVDKKNPYLICPATVGTVNGDKIELRFDGWRGSFDYTCDYYSREIFPVNWCYETNHPIAAPNGWEGLIKNDTKSSPGKPTLESPSKRLGRTSFITPKAPKTSPPLRATKKTPPSVSLIKLGSPKKQDKKPISKPQESKQAQHQDNQSPEDYAEPDPNLDSLDAKEMNNKFQCQRTVPYCDWLKLKQEQRATETSVGTSTDESTDTLLQKLSPPKPTPFRASGEPDSNSDTCSLSSHDIPYTSNSDKSSSSREPPPVKKIRTDTSNTDDSHEKFEAQPRSNTNSNDYKLWTVEDVSQKLKADPTLAKYRETFESHEIDGKAFVLLTTDIMLNHMGLKIGPVLKINDLIERVKRAK